MSDPKAAKNQIRGSALLMAGRGLSVGLNFLTQILTVRYLAKSDYGAFAYALAMASFVAQISRFGMDKAISRFAAIQDERGEYGRLFGTLVFSGALVLVCGTVLAVSVYSLGETVGATVVSDPLSLHLLLILIALAPVDGLDYVLQSVFATFSRPRLIVFRKYVVGPALKLLAIVGVMVAAADVETLAYARLGASVLGLVIAGSLIGRVLRERDLLGHFDWKRIEVRAKEIMSFSLPMLGSDAVLLLRGALVVFFLEFFQGAASVADFRSVLPLARLNNVALDSFAFLFVPAVARLTASPDDGTLNDMYWRSATWVTVLSLPVFLATFALAGPFTVTLFGDRYADAAPVLTLLSAGTFVHASMAMSGLVLKAAGRVKNVLAVDAAALALEVVLILVMIPRFGAVGAAVAYGVTSAAHAGVYHLVLVRKMDVRLLPFGFSRVYAAIALAGGFALAFAGVMEPPLWLGILVVGGLWLGLLLRVSHDLDVSSTFPELMRVPVLGRLLEGEGRRSRERTVRSSAVAMLEEGAASLEPELGPPPHTVRGLRTRRRASSTLLELDVEGADGHIPMLLKVCTPGVMPETPAVEVDFPRIGVHDRGCEIIDGERVTLSAVEGMLADLDDPRLGAVKVYDGIDARGVVAMRRLEWPNLRDLVHRECWSPWNGASPLLRRASRNAGAWLRTFQSLPPLDHSRPRHTDRASFLAAMEEFTAYLSDSRADAKLVREVHDAVEEAAASHDPSDPTCALGHGDYAGRNVLVGPDGRVAVVDTPGRWVFPAYLDIGYFLADLRTSWVGAVTGGWLPRSRLLEEVESAFLEGYFGSEPVARRPVRLFEAFALSARWVSTHHTLRTRGWPQRAAGRVRARSIRARLRAVVHELRGASDSAASPTGLARPRDDPARQAVAS